MEEFYPDDRNLLVWKLLKRHHIQDRNLPLTVSMSRPNNMNRAMGAYQLSDIFNANFAKTTSGD